MPKTNLWDALDPRRSLAAAVMWLIIALAATFAIAAAVWVGRIARQSVLEQHVRRLLLETDQLSSDLGQAIAGRLDAVRAAGQILQVANGTGRPNSLGEVFAELQSAYPQLDWLEIADTGGRIIAAHGVAPAAARAVSDAWFVAGQRGPWLGIADPSPTRLGPETAALGELSAPVRDPNGKVAGVILARLSWRRAPYHPERLTDEAASATEAYVLDRSGLVLVGPDPLRGKPWFGTPLEAGSPAASALGAQFERLPNGRRVLVARALVSATSEVALLGWQALISEPNERVYQRADALTLKILGISICLGLATALLGALAARQLTLRLKRLTRSVAAVGSNEGEPLEIPAGFDEVARLGRAFATILGDLQRERRELQILSGELERRVTVRTREVERLAEESRYAAIVRERLKIARDLHDTLAHSMMAILSEIRFLRRLQTREPAQLPAELARAEEVAHEGLKEVRSAIMQMRVNAVRETGLGPALANEFERFINRSGLAGEFSADVESGRFGDERAESLLRIVQEALRNVEQHAMATRASVTLSTTADGDLRLEIADDGIGFDPEAAYEGHFGILGLRELAEIAGATLAIESGANRGTTIRLRLRMAPATFTPE